MVDDAETTMGKGGRSNAGEITDPRRFFSTLPVTMAHSPAAYSATKVKMNLPRRLLVCLLLTCLHGSSAARILRVPGEYPTIDAAVTASANHDEVVLDPGTYRGTGNRGIWITGKAVTVRSQAPDDPGVVGDTVIDGELLMMRAFTIANEATNTVLSGLTFVQCRPAIYMSAANPVISKCVFKHNLSALPYGGAIQCAGGSSPRIENCLFIGNCAPGVQARGGAVSCAASDAQIVFCTFVYNAARKGGALWITDFSSVMVRNCIFWENVACENASMQIGLDTGTAAVNYCLVQNGTAKPWFGSGCLDADPLLTADGYLRAGSPCIDSATPIMPDPVPTTDREGESRSSGSRPDMGSDEYVDFDGNGLPDRWESRYFGTSTPLGPDGDPDGDELTTGREYVAASNPMDPDTDGDTWSDGKEVRRGTNPAGPNMFVDPVAGDDILDGRAPVYVGGQTGPKQHVQTAISAAGHGDSVVLAPGVYSGNANYELDVSMGMGGGWRAVTIQSEDPHDPAVVAATVIDPQHLGRAFYFHTEMSGLVRVRGLTLRNGLCSTASPHGEQGGAVLCYGASPVIERCIIEDNATSDTGVGGGLALIDSSAIIRHCLVSRNTSDDDGGGVYCNTEWGSDYGTPRLFDCTITDNTAAGDGGGVYAFPPRQIIQNCVIARNAATNSGGGVWCRNCDLDIEHCTIVGNQPDGVFSVYNTFPDILNSILWYNRPVQIDESSPRLFFCNVEGGWPAGYGETLTNAPDFVDAAGDYHLRASSPCIDAGTNLLHVVADRDAVPRPLDGDDNGAARSDMGAYEFVHPTADTDGDHVSDSRELASGTNPADGSDYLAIGSATYDATSDSFVVSWQSTRGFLYSLMSADEPGATWVDVPDCKNVPGTGDRMCCGVVPSAGTAVYRLRVAPSP